MHAAIEPLLVLVILLNFFMLGTSRLRAMIQASGAQGVVLGLLLALVHGHLDLRTVLFAVGTILVKAVLIPGMLLRAMREASIRREVEPLIGFVPSLFLGALGTGLALVFADSLPVVEEHVSSLAVPAALSTVVIGFLVLVTRLKAITQVVGYLILENGIFIMGLSLVNAMPALVEIGILLDLVVGMFVLGIIINHINRTYASLDTDRLNKLRE